METRQDKRRQVKTREAQRREDKRRQERTSEDKRSEEKRRQEKTREVKRRQVETRGSQKAHLDHLVVLGAKWFLKILRRLISRNGPRRLSEGSFGVFPGLGPHTAPEGSQKAHLEVFLALDMPKTARTTQTCTKSPYKHL